MKKLALMSLIISLSFVVSPVKADTNIYLSSYKRPPRYFPAHFHKWHRNHQRIVMPIFMPPFFDPPKPRVIVEKRVVQYVPVQAPLQATPISASYVDVSGQYCREYQASTTLNGASEVVYGTACQQPDGSWRVVN